MEGNKRFKTVQGSNRANTEKRQRNLVNKLKSLKKKNNGKGVQNKKLIHNMKVILILFLNNLSHQKIFLARSLHSDDIVVVDG